MLLAGVPTWGRFLIIFYGNFYKNHYTTTSPPLEAVPELGLEEDPGGTKKSNLTSPVVVSQDVRTISFNFQMFFSKLTQRYDYFVSHVTSFWKNVLKAGLEL